MSEKSKRLNYLKQSGIKGIAAWTMLFVFAVKMIYISYQTGMNGVSFYAYGNILFVLCYILFGVAVVGIEKRLIYFQFNHGNYKNAMKVYRVITGMLLIVATALAVGLFFGAPKLSVLLFQTKLCSLQIRIMAVAIWFWIMMFSLKGYMDGIGNPMPGIYADLLSFLTALLVTVFTQRAFIEYGTKVSALMRQESYLYAYASCSGALGLAVGGVLGMLFLLMVRTVFGKEIRRRVRNDDAHKTDSTQDILWNFFGNYFKNILVEHIGVILAIVLFMVYAHMSGLAQDGAGLLYVGMAVVILPVALLAWQISLPFVKQLTAIMKQSDYHHAKERMCFYLKLLSYTTLPLVAVGMALASLLSDVLFDVEKEALAGVIRIGMIGAALVVYGIFLRQAMSVLVKPYIRNLSAGLLGLSGIGFWFVLSMSNQTPEECVAYAYVLANLLFLLVAGFLVLKKIRIYNRLFECLGIPLIGAVIAAAVAFGIYALLLTAAPSGVVMILSMGAAYLIFELVCVFLHLFEAHEWREVPACGLPVAIAKIMGKY